MHLRLRRFGLQFLLVCLSVPVYAQKGEGPAVPVSSYGPGDVDGNGFVELFDVLLVRDILIGRIIPSDQQRAAADVDGNGSIEIGDVDAARELILAYLPNLSPTPEILRILPAEALPRESVEIYGSGLGASPEGNTIRIGSLTLTDSLVDVWSPDRIAFRVPQDATSGELAVLVGGRESNAVNLRVIVVDLVAPDPQDFTETADGVPFVRDIVIVDFVDSLSLNTIDAFLEARSLDRIGLLLRPRLVRARIRAGGDPFALAETLLGLEGVETAAPAVLSKTETVVSESFPKSFNDTYDPAARTFDKDKVESWYHHFAMQTFAGHRIVEYYMGQVAAESLPDVRIAIVDGGLGNGTTNSPAEFSGRVRKPTDVGIGAASGLSSGLTDIINIPDLAMHGTPVASVAAGAGLVALGTGKHVNIRPLRTSFSDGTFDPLFVAGALEIAAADPYVKVINLSLGSYDASFIELRNTISRELSLRVYGNEMDYALGRGKIIVTAAGNEQTDTDLSMPSTMAPERPRTGNARNVLNVAATSADPHLLSTVREISADYSNFGHKVSVSAPGTFLFPYSAGILDADYRPTDIQGTSFSAPIVAGLAAEMIYLDELLVLLGSRETTLSPARIVEFIEETADDLGSRGADNFFGEGRVNVWKAILATVNGGLSREITTPAWYGFEIRAPLEGNSQATSERLLATYDGAGIRVDGLKLQDSGNSDVPDSDITLFKRVAPVRTDGTTLSLPLPLRTRQPSELIANFSVTTDEVNGSAGQAAKMQIARSGNPATDVPLFEFPMHLAQMRGDTPAFVEHEDFIFTIIPPHVVEVRSIAAGSARSVTEMEGGVSVQYPIAKADDELEIKVSYPGFELFPENTDIQFYNPSRELLQQPTSIVSVSEVGITALIKVDVAQDAQTGPVNVRTILTGYEGVISFSSLLKLVVPKVVGVTASGTSAGDDVSISIDVPHFSANTGNVRIVFPGTTTEVAPDRVSVSGTPGATHAIAAKIPAGTIAGGALKIVITIDNNQKLEFEGGRLALTDKTDYAAIATVTNFIVTDPSGTRDLTPPSGMNMFPQRFVLNRVAGGGTQGDSWFFDGSTENTWFRSLENVIGTDDGSGTILFEESFTTAQANGTLRIEARFEGTTLNGTYRTESAIPAFGLTSLTEFAFAASPESDPSLFNGAFFGRAALQSKTGDEDLLKLLEDLSQQRSFALGIVETGGVIGLTFLNETPVDWGSGQLLSRLLKNEPRMLEGPAMEGGGFVLSAIIGTLNGSNATFLLDQTGLFNGVDPDPNSDFRITFDLNSGSTAVTGTVSYYYELMDTDEAGNPITRTAEMIYAYTGTRLDEGENRVSITGLFPQPEDGFPQVQGATLSLTSVNAAYNYVDSEAASITLRVFANNDPGLVLFESSQTIGQTTVSSGFRTFSNIMVPGIDASVTQVGVVVGILKSGATNFTSESAVLTYAR